MTKWKQQIDQHLGNEPKFNAELKQQILHKASKQPPRKVQWTYAATLVSICVVALLLVLVGPPQQVPQQQSANVVLIDQMMQLTGVETVYVNSDFSERDEFIARDSIWYIGSERISEPANIQLVTTMFTEMVMAEEVTSSWNSTDMVAVLTDGTRVKVKLYDYGTWVGIVDMQTKLFYSVDGELAKKIQQQFLYINMANPLALLLLIPIYVLQWLLPKVFRIKQQKRKFVNKAHIIFVTTFIVAGCLLLILSSQKSLPVFIPAILIVLFLLFLLDAWFGWKYAKEQGYYKVSLVMMVLAPIFMSIMALLLT